MRPSPYALFLTLALPLAGLHPAYALSAAEEEIVRGVESIYLQALPDSVPGAPAATNLGRPGFGCGSPQIRNAMDRWDELSPEAKARLEPLMQSSTLSPDGLPAAAGEGEKRIDTAHFAVYYKTSGEDAPPPKDANGNGVPDYIDDAQQYLEKAYTKEVNELGFKAPPAQRIVVHFRKLNNNGVTHPTNNSTCWIELNSDILGFTKKALGSYYNPSVVARDPNRVQESLLEAVCAHEFYHVVQAQYTWNLPDWWMEGNADWMGNEVFPDSGFYLNNVGPHLEQPHVSLFASGNFFEYSASLFMIFLSENQNGPKTVRAVWEACKIPERIKARMGTDDKGGARTLQIALVKELGSLPETYMAFSINNVLRGYKDSKRMPAPPTLQVKSYPSTVKPQAGKEPQYYGANFIELFPTENPTTLKLEGTFGALNAHRVKIITIEKGSEHWTILRQGLVDGKLSVQIPEFGGRIRKAVVVVGGFSQSSKGDYSLTATAE